VSHEIVRAAAHRLARSALCRRLGMIAFFFFFFSLTGAFFGRRTFGFRRPFGVATNAWLFYRISSPQKKKRAEPS